MARDPEDRHGPPTPRRLPAGRLVRSRVVTDLGAVLADALDRRLDGYAVVEPQDALLLDAAGPGVLGFRSGAPAGAYHAGTARGGPAALADLAADGPCRVELRALDADAAALRAFDRDAVRVAAATPAERLAGDQALAARTRRVVDDTRRVGGRGAPAPHDPDPGPAPARTGDEGPARGDAGRSGPRPDAGHRSRPGTRADADDAPEDPVVAFLEDDERIAAIRDQAREQARERAAEWGLTDQLED
jgi:hypothetical protein